MALVLGAIGAGAAGLAVVIVGLFSVLGRHNSAGARARRLQATDPRLAQELRDVQSEMHRAQVTRTIF